MNIDDFKSGVLKKQLGYKSFTPENVNHNWLIIDTKINSLLSDADRKMGELESYSKLIIDVNFFVKMHIAKEATLSSKIEGTQTSIDETLQSAENIDPEKRDDWNEVHNYIEAMNFAISALDTLPLSTRLLRETHKILLQGVRGKHKLPGEFRSSQNWIGGATLTDATFIPPHYLELPELMSDLELFLNNEYIHVPHLIRIGIAHYQFETIHPFLDGNGRLGRLLITLYLVSNKILSKPALYLSDFFDRNRSHYYNNLTLVREQNQLKQWLTFFLVGINETAQNAIDTFKKIIVLRRIVEDKIKTLGKRTSSGEKFLELLFSQPIIETTQVAKNLSVNVSTANRLIDSFVKLEILKEQTGFRRNRIFIFEEYVKLFR